MLDAGCLTSPNAIRAPIRYRPPMNYLSHGIAFLDEPLTLAGSVTPDLLSVVDRRCRVKLRRIEPVLESGDLDDSTRAVLRGFEAHLVDDHWFHANGAFLEAQSQLLKLFRAAMPDDDTHRVGFLGHIVVELLLDRWIMERNPQALDRFYAAFSEADPQVVQHAVSFAAKRPTDKLLPFWHRFVDERFLADYPDPNLMLWRLNHVMKRVSLPPLEDHIEQVLVDSYAVVSQSATDLLPKRVLASL